MWTGECRCTRNHWPPGIKASEHAAPDLHLHREHWEPQTSVSARLLLTKTSRETENQGHIYYCASHISIYTLHMLCLNSLGLIQSFSLYEYDSVPLKHNPGGFLDPMRWNRASTIQETSGAVTGPIP